MLGPTITWDPLLRGIELAEGAWLTTLIDGVDRVQQPLGKGVIVKRPLDGVCCMNKYTTCWQKGLLDVKGCI